MLVQIQQVDPSGVRSLVSQREVPDGTILEVVRKGSSDFMLQAPTDTVDGPAADDGPNDDDTGDATPV